MPYRTIDADAHVIETPYTFEFMEKGEEKFRPLVTTQVSGATLLSNEGNVRKDFWLVDNHAYAKDRNVNTQTLEEHREMRDVKGRVKHMDELATFTLFRDADSREWVLKRDGAQRALKRFTSKTLAMEHLPKRFGDRYPTSIKIQKQDGTLEEERTYPRSMDSRRSKG